jgi:hypothetical protein
MGRLIEWNDRDKFRKRVADVLNISEVLKDGRTMADSNGVVDLSILSVIQEEIDIIMRYLDIDVFYKDEHDDVYTDENGFRYSSE